MNHKISFNGEELFLLERAVDIMSGYDSLSIESADKRIKSILANKELLSKEVYTKNLDSAIRDWNDAMTYFYVYRDISERLQKLRWRNSKLIEFAKKDG